MSWYEFAINRTNKTMNVYNPANSSQRIGRVFPNEIFQQFQGEQFYAVRLLSSSGSIIGGEANTGESSAMEVLNAWDSITKYPYYGEASPNSYDAPYVFKVRRTTGLYNKNGKQIGSVAGGMYVATDKCLAGETMPYLMKIIYAKQTSGNWIKLDEGVNNYGFVDTGLRTASGANNFGLIGSFNS